MFVFVLFYFLQIHETCTLEEAAGTVPQRLRDRQAALTTTPVPPHYIQRLD